MERALEAHDGAFSIPKPLRAWLGSASLLLGSVLGLFLVAQVASFVSTWQTLPLWAQWVSGIGVGSFSLILFAYILRLFGFIGKLNANQQIRVQAIQAMQERRLLQQLSAERASEASKQLRAYLKSHPAKSDASPPVGISPEQWSSLATARIRLLESSRGNTPTQWIDDFHKHFQSTLDKAASARVEAYARRAGISTAASPNPLVDQMICVYICTAMLGDLMKLYHLRPVFGQSAVLLSQTIAHTYLAGLMEGASEGAADTFGDSLANLWEPAGGTLAKGIGARTAEGGLNWYLVRRLGKTAIKLLQPVRA